MLMCKNQFPTKMQQMSCIGGILGGVSLSDTRCGSVPTGPCYYTGPQESGFLNRYSGGLTTVNTQCMQRNTV